MNNTIEILTNHQTEFEVTISRCGCRQTEDGPKVNRRLRKHLATKRHAAHMTFLHSIHDEILAKNPTAYMTTAEALAFMKEREKRDQDRFDNSPCPLEERADLEGVADAAGSMERALRMAGGDTERLAD